MADTAQPAPHIGLEYGYSIATAAIIIIAGCVLIGIIEHVSQKFLAKRSAQIGKVVKVFSVSLKILTGLLAFLGVLISLRIDLTGVLTGLGLTSFALGYALKDAISNLLAGIMIIIYRPYSTGDYIEVSGCKGTVGEINLRYTILHFEGAEYLVPNSLCMTNWLKKEEKSLSAAKPESGESQGAAATEKSSQDTLDDSGDAEKSE